ncbi:conserved hypothetical protein [Ricinus communis]|uniref:Uncharacterized protein n=1 Tax=Ricinus communis TaxID=3988 RepID=B9RPT6_RICCO|nr:conserved hypothetical protein [Ricinus communis]
MNSQNLFIPQEADPLQEHKVGFTGRHEHDINGDGDGNRRSGIVHSNKFAHGGVNGGRSNGGAANNGGGSTGAAGAANNGGGSTGAAGIENGNGNGNSNGQGGAAVIPVIVAGAANNRHPNSHRGAASSNRNAVGFPAMIMITLATFIVNLSVDFSYRI